MTTCAKCGAEAVGGSPNCPRCGAPLPSDRSARGLAVASLVIGTACALGVVVNMIVDYALHGFIGTISLINLASSAAGWLLIGFPMLSYRRPAVFLPVMAAVAVAYLWVLERLTGGSGWFLSLALPISASGIVVGALTAWACWRAKRHGPNIAALILLGCTVVCMSIESILSLSASGALRLGWSAIVAAAAIPTAVLLFSLNGRLRRRGLDTAS
jgi:hypothetical protein